MKRRRSSIVRVFGYFLILFVVVFDLAGILAIARLTFWNG